jgi:microcystin-dependent protein
MKTGSERLFIISTLTQDTMNRRKQLETMTEPTLGDIQWFAFSFAPEGWLPCDGRTLAIRDHANLYDLLGTRYGGDGQSTFGLPDLRGRVALGTNPDRTDEALGQVGGVSSVTLTLQNLPSHRHTVRVSSTSTSTSPEGGFYGPAPEPFYDGYSLTPAVTAEDTLASVGAGVPHENRQPYLVLNPCIAVVGAIPT